MSEPARVTREMLSQRIKQPDSSELDELFTGAKTMVDERLERAFRDVPPWAYREIVLRVGHALWESQKSAHGTNQQVTMEGQVPVRSPRDPFTAAQPLINNYVLGFG